MIAVNLPFNTPASTALANVAFEQFAVGVGGHHAGPHQRERGCPDPLEVVAHTHRRLPVQIDPGAPSRSPDPTVRSWVAHSIARTITDGA